MPKLWLHAGHTGKPKLEVLGPVDGELSFMAGGAGQVLEEVVELREHRPKAERVNDAVDHELRMFAQRQSGSKYDHHLERLSRQFMILDKLKGELVS